ncbi:MAG: hypothetical protein M1827_004263 [Pycnora praestabilis]|nr:MAG: hypothetical protein M1827_004263 [Pycnora praestabilis]
MVASPLPIGVYVPVPTFFVPRDGSGSKGKIPSIDLETQASHAIHLARCGIKGLVILGTTGEAINLSNTERVQVLSHVKRELEAAGFLDYPIIAGTATQNVEDTILQLEEAQRAGAQWGLVLAPGYFAPFVSQDSLVAWYTAVADSSPMPIMIYHYPAVSNNINISSKTFETLSSHPNIVGCKLSHGDIAKHTLIACNPRINHETFRVFTGLGQQLLPVLTIGCAGAIDGLAGVFPRCVVYLFQLITGSSNNVHRLKDMREIQYKISAAEEMMVKWGPVGVKEAVSRVLGFGDKDGTRVPLYPGFPNSNEWEAWTEFMGELVELEASLSRGDMVSMLEASSSNRYERVATEIGLVAQR